MVGKTGSGSGRSVGKTGRLGPGNHMTVLCLSLRMRSQFLRCCSGGIF